LKIAIVGCGNILLGDEGVGPYVVEEIKKRGVISSDVKLIELGVRGLELVDLIGRYGKIFIVDAVKTGGKAGSVHIFSCDDIQSLPSFPILTLHDLGLITVLKLCEKLYGNVSGKIKIYGVEVSDIESVRSGLSGDGKRGASKVIRLLEKEVSAILK
jgi:hydrogenase maturation protease